MSFELRDQNGTLFKNKDKNDENNFPNFRGDCMVNGVKMEVSAWTKRDKNNNVFFSLAFKEPYVKRPTEGATTSKTRDTGPAPQSQSKPQGKTPDPWDTEINDDIPF